MANRDGAGGRSWTLGLLPLLLITACSSGTPAAPTSSANPRPNPTQDYCFWELRQRPVARGASDSM
jgi:hypothetical protein